MFVRNPVMSQIHLWIEVPLLFQVKISRLFGNETPGRYFEHLTGKK